MVKVTITIENHVNIKEKIPEIKRKGLQYTSQGMIRQLTLNSPVQTGLLHQWAAQNINENEIKITSPAAYAKFVNDGTGIYGPKGTPIIHPSIGKKFAFQIGGQMIYTNVIRGQKGQHFVEKSISETKDKLAGFFIKAVRKVLS